MSVLSGLQWNVTLQTPWVTFNPGLSVNQPSNSWAQVSVEWGTTVDMGVCVKRVSVDWGFTVQIGVCIKYVSVESGSAEHMGVRINFHCTYKSIMRTMYFLMRKASRNITILSLFTLRRISNSWSDSSLSASSSYLMILAT